jgi:hypothetical protein
MLHCPERKSELINQRQSPLTFALATPAFVDLEKGGDIDCSSSGKETDDGKACNLLIELNDPLIQTLEKNHPNPPPPPPPRPPPPKTRKIDISDLDLQDIFLSLKNEIGQCNLLRIRNSSKTPSDFFF